jgi:glycosyltransferase involved in cell wall biosynthesis
MEQGARPLVSCVLLTRNRPRLVKQAIWYFLRQDYEPRELIVIDDGDDSVRDQVPADRRIRYVRLPARLSLGERLNIGYELAGGELVARWEQGDWIGPHRLGQQVEQIGGQSAALLDRTLQYCLEQGTVWRQRSGRPSPGTLLDRKSRWSRSRFPATDREEHIFESISQADGGVSLIEGSGSYVAVAYPGDPSPSHAGDFEPRPASELGGVIGWDASFYVELRTKRAWSAEAPRGSSTIRLVAPLFVYDGYGSMGEYLALGMSRAGADVTITPLRLDDRGTSEELRTLLRRSTRPRPEEPTLCLAWWGDNLDRFSAHDLFVNTMWESSKIPADWPGRLARSRAVIVPSRFAAQVFRDCGVAAPIEVVAQGVDPDVYHYEERPDTDGLVTLMVGVFVPRKNVMEGIEAWQRAFAGDPSARLIIKSRFGGARYLTEDDRISFVDTDETTRGIAHWYREASVLMALGNEGFGLPLVEGMATGLPVIALESEGQADVCGEAPDLVLPVPPGRWEHVTNPGLGDGGVRAIPSVDHIVRHLRWVAEHREEARAMGRAASRWALRYRNVWAMGPAVLDVMEGRMCAPRPLRRRTVVCCPDIDCSAIDYARHLAGELGYSIAVADRPADLRGVALLHFQHSPGVWDELQLTQLVQEARYSGIPVVVTEHSVDDRTSAWEQVATALVVDVAAGADVLRSRLPDARIEVVPPGCPNWVEPRAQARGRTVAVIGWPQLDQGWWTMLDALRSRRGVRLLALRRGGAEADWQPWLAEASDLPVEICEVSDARTAAETASRNADAVVLWHDAAPGLGTSYQARVALASGLPVMTSPAPQFADLDAAVYQPSCLVDGLDQILEDEALRQRVVEAATRFRQAHAWSQTAERHRALWSSLSCA